MTLELGTFDVMAYLWGTIDKTEDGEHVRYTVADVEQLWHMGFVDTARITMSEWKRLFEPHRQPDGSFLLGHDDFLALDAYRYKGEIRIPFDPMKINEGKYTDEGLDELIEASVVPSCSLAREQLQEFFTEFKGEFRDGSDGLIVIRAPAKQRIRALLDAHPSPLRNLELLLDRMLGAHEEEFEEQLDRSEVDAATAEAARQVSRFSAKPTSSVEAKADKLKQVTKARKKKPQQQDDGKSKKELKKIKRSRKGMRG